MKLASAVAAALLCAALPAQAAEFSYSASGLGQAPIETFQQVDATAGDFSAVTIMIELIVRAQQGIAPPDEDIIDPLPPGAIRIDEFNGTFLTQYFSNTANAGEVVVRPAFLPVVQMVTDEEGYEIEASYSDSITFTDAATIALFQNGLFLSTTFADALIEGNTDLLTRSLDGFPQFTWSANYTVAFTPAAPIPEPAAWAMMIAGFGLVGGGMRAARRRDSVAASA